MKKLLAMLGAVMILAGCASNPVDEHYRGPDRGFLVFSLQGGNNYELNYKLKGATSGQQFGGDGVLTYNPYAIMGTHVDVEEGLNKVVIGVHSLKPGDYEIYTFGTFGFNGAVGYPSGQVSPLPFSIKPGETTYIGNFDSRPSAFEIYFIVTDKHERDMATARRKEASLPEPVTLAVPDVARMGRPYFRPN